MNKKKEIDLRYKCLLIEDEAKWIKLIQQQLSEYKSFLEIIPKQTYNDAICYLTQESLPQIDFIILDLKLPWKGTKDFPEDETKYGCGILKHVKKREDLKHIPVFIFSSKIHRVTKDVNQQKRIQVLDSILKRVLESGAESFYFKDTFDDIAEGRSCFFLKLIIRNNLKLSEILTCKCGSIQFNLSTQEVSINSVDINLTSSEKKLLRCFLSHQNIPKQKHVIANDVLDANEDTLKEHISNLNKKIKKHTIDSVSTCNSAAYKLWCKEYW